MRTHAAHVRSRHVLLALAILIATLLLLHTHAWGQIVDDPARGPFDDRVPVPAVEWTVSSGENVETPIPAVAVGLSAAATIGSTVVLAIAIADDQPQMSALGAAGFALGPSLGQWYGGRAWNPGLATRLGGLIVGGASTLLVLGCTDGETGESCDFGGDGVLLGAAAYVAGATYEIVTPVARTVGRRHARLIIVPMRGHEQIVPGMALTSRF